MSDFADYQRITQWIGASLDTRDDLAVGNGTVVVGTYDVGNWASIIVWIKPTGNNVTVTITQKPRGAPAGLEASTTFTAADGVAKAQQVVLFADRVQISVTGTVPGSTADFMLLPANTATQSQSLGAVLTVQKNGLPVGSRDTIDFEDAGAAKWDVTEDSANNRIKVTPPRIITGRVTGAGVIVAGTGFTVNRTGAGSYTITFTTAFAAVPIVLPELVAVSAGRNVQPSGATANGVTIITFDVPGGPAVDADFQFLAYATG